MARFSNFLNTFIRGEDLVPLPLLSRQADSDSGWLNCERYSTLSLVLAVTVLKGTSPTCDVTIATADDDEGTGAVTLATYTQVTAPGSAQKIVTGLSKFYRVSYVLDDTGGDGAVAASAVLTSDNTNVANNATVTIGAKTYTFKTALTPAEGEVLIGGSADASLLNLKNAINHTGTPDTDYKCAAVHPTVTAGVIAAHALTLAAKTAGLAGNDLASTETSAHLSFAGATFVLGEDALAVTFSVKGYGK